MRDAIIILAFALTLRGCGGESVASPIGASPVVPQPVSLPLPPPSPAPSATPATRGDGSIVVITEGSSSAISWGGSHTGMYAASRNDIVYQPMATGGAGITKLQQRLPEVLASRPDLVSIYIGANDLESYSNVDAFMAELKKYVDEIRSSGAKVVICNLLPRQTGRPSDLRYNKMRKEYSAAIKLVNWVDGVVDFAGHPEMGPDDAPNNLDLYSDGVHPTTGSNREPESGQKKLFAIYKPIMDGLAADVR